MVRPDVAGSPDVLNVLTPALLLLCALYGARTMIENVTRGYTWHGVRLREYYVPFNLMELLFLGETSKASSIRPCL